MFEYALGPNEEAPLVHGETNLIQRSIPIKNEQLTELLWNIYQSIGRSNASRDLSDTQKAELVEDLRKAAQLLEDALPVYN